MFSLLRLCLGLATAAGISTSIAVPVVLKTQGKNTAVTRVSIAVVNSEVSVKLEKCGTSPNSSTELAFGSVSKEEVCWHIQEESQPVSSETSLTSLLKDNWNITSSDWTETQDWKTECSSKWEVWSTEDSEKHLGLCNNSKEWNQTPFVKKKHESTKTSISVCFSDCWEESSGVGVSQTSRKQLQSEKGSHWKLVKFFKKGSS